MEQQQLELDSGPSSPSSSSRPSLRIDVTGANRARLKPTKKQLKLADINKHERDEQLKLDHEHPMQHQQYSPGEEHEDRYEGEEREMDDDELEYHHHQYSQQQQLHQGEHEMMDGEEGEDDEDEDDGGEFSDSLSSSPSIPDEDIDFSLVYALHTFLATVDGQASVVKGDKLLLLDDSNSYWWLVRVLKTQAVGYIPAENIETPWERLARLNKHRNVDLTSATQQDLVTGPNSTAAQTRFVERIPPSQQPHPHESQHPISKGVLASPSHKDHPRNISPTRPERAGSNKRKTVFFSAPVYYAHSASGLTDEDDEEYSGEEGEEGELVGDQQFEEDDEEGEEDEESEFSDENLTEDIDQAGGDARPHPHQRQQQQGYERRVVEQSQQWHEGQQAEYQDANEDEHRGSADWEHEQRLRQEAAQAQWEADQKRERSLSPQQQESLHRQQQQKLYEQQQAQLAAQQHQQRQQQKQQQVDRDGHHAAGAAAAAAAAAAGAASIEGYSRRPSSDDFGPDAPTKKLTATPPIVRDPTFDINDPYADQGGLPRSESPQRVRGVEVVDPKDPRYNRLILAEARQQDEVLQQQTSARPSADYAQDADTSLNSMDTSSSFQSGLSNISAEEGGPRTQSSGKKLKKGGRDSIIEPDGDKKRKSGGGILSGLFRKKDKKKKDSKDDLGADARSSEDSMRNSTHTNVAQRKPANGQPIMIAGGAINKRESQTGESMFSTDAALRQQQLEAKQAMYHQYGVQRNPGDHSNTMTPRAGAANANLSPIQGSFNNSLQPPQRVRPGSLVGSPSIPGLEVPLLSVLRVFAGDNIEAEATFKTVLLNRTTTTADLVKQSMQRFRLTGVEDDRDQYYLTVKELGGEERELEEDQMPLVVFETLADAANDGFIVPSVKRSSVGSINSISSNLSMNPAITRLGMNDWSDDSAVKFYLNRHLPEQTGPNSDDESVSTATAIQPAPIAKDEPSLAGGPTSYRFAVRVLIHPSDLPENVVFDPQSAAIIPKAALIERSKRSSFIEGGQGYLPDSREKIIFFPRNVNVSEVIEAALDRFGIVDGVVDGGDEVEDRVSKRRSVSRVKYNLAVEKDGRESVLSSSGKLLDSYRSPPLFKAYDRSSKEFRRRSVDATLILGSSQDIAETDPVFVIRRAPLRLGRAAAGPVPTTIDELEEREQHQTVAQVPRLSAEEEDERAIARAAEPGATRQEIIAAQRAASRANQRAILSAQKNADQGVDINIANEGTIRSSRAGSNEQVRYSFIDRDGTEVDVSEHVQSEWAPDRAPSSSSRYTTATTGDNDSFVSARETLGSGSEGMRSVSTLGQPEDNPEDEDDQALNALRSAQVNIGGEGERALHNAPSNSSLRSRTLSPPMGKQDLLQESLGPRPVTSPLLNESLQDRLDRVLAKVKDDKARRADSPALGGRPRSRQSNNGRVSPAFSAGTNRAQSPLNGLSSSVRGSPSAASGTQSRSRSPLEGRDSPTIEQIIGSSGLSAKGSPIGASGMRSMHRAKHSIGSISSTQSSVLDQPQTASTGLTPMSSANSNHPQAQARAGPPPPVYREQFGLENLVALVNAEEHSGPSTALPRESRVDALFSSRSLRSVDVHPDVRSLYEPHARTLDDLDSRLDEILSRLVTV